MGMPVTGKLLKDIAPADGHPRNSEGAFITLKDGRIMFIYSAFIGEGYYDHAFSSIAKIVSSDGGATWTEPETIAVCSQYNAVNIMSVSLMRMQNGDIGLFYLIRQTFHDMRLVLRRSSDEGETWSDHVMCMPRTGYFVVNNDRVIRLKSGRILIPAAEHVPTDVPWNTVPDYSRATSTFFYSDDDGKTFREAWEMVALHGVRSFSGLQEPGVIELNNGVLWAFSRTDLGRQYEFFSMDGGSNWSDAAPSRFWSPLSPLSMKRMPDGRILAVWNPIPQYETRDIKNQTGGRSPLVYALSSDEGKSFTGARVIENEEIRGYCYTAIHFVEDGVLLAYCAGDGLEDKTCLNRLRIMKLSYSEMEG